MSTSLYNEEYADFRHRGDYVQVDGELKALGGATLSGTITSSAASFTALKLSSAPTGTTAGTAWTSGAPALTAGQLYITVTAGSTTYRIPVWANE